MARRRINILCVQETRWKGNKAKELGDGYKLIYSGTDERGRNGVGIVLDQDIKEQIVEVERKSSRILKIKLLYGQETLNVVSAYAPQTGCSDVEKEEFWLKMDEVLRGIPAEERCIVGGDLNGHIGRDKTGYERIHGGRGMGDINQEGESILDFALAFDLAIQNSFFTKRSHRTYKSGGNESQIDFLLYTRGKIREVEDCKTLPGECVGKQHAPVIMEIVLHSRVSPIDRGEPKIKWWKLGEEEVGKEFKAKVLDRLREEENVEDWWKINSEIIRKTGEEILGKSSGRKPRNDKETWWWSTHCSEAIEKKKKAKKTYDRERTEENKATLKEASKGAKKAVAQAKAAALESMYENLESREGQKRIFKVAKERNKASKDITAVKQIKDKDENVLVDPDMIKQRWKDYYEELLNQENPRVRRGGGVGRLGEVPPITETEVNEALRKVKRGKGVGPDLIPAEVWMVLEQKGRKMLTKLFNKILDEECMPEEWRESIMVPIFKEKGDIQKCKNYRGIKLTSHTLKIFERVLDKRLREETEIRDEQFGFMKGRGTVDAIFALRQVMEKYLEKQRGLYLAFVDLEKAYDRVPRGEVWRSMRMKGVKEKYVRVVKDMYRGARTRVRSAVGTTDAFPVQVGLHQGSALSPYLFNLLMDTLLEETAVESPWRMLFADDIVLIAESREELQNRLEECRMCLEEYGLKVTREKTEYVEFNSDDGGDIMMQGHSVTKADSFKYLGSMVSQDGSIDKEVGSRVQAAWNNWRRTSGVLCDKRISARVKGRVYKAVVRPALLYGAETWALKKVQERKIDVAEMRMLRWMCGVTKLDKIRNVHIRGTVKVVEASSKAQEKRLQWYGHVKRRDEEYVGVRTMRMEVAGRRRRGRPRLRWRDRIRVDLEERQIDEEQTEDRNLWRRLVRTNDPI